MGDNAVSCRAAGWWRGKAPHAGAAAAVAAVIDIFITPGGSTVSGPEIISNTGKVIWFHPLPAHELASDFRTQTYRGKPVLTWWQGPADLGAISTPSRPRT
jgi:hypothetical protein